MMLHLMSTLKKFHQLSTLHVSYFYFLRLIELYKVTDICYYTDEMEKAPILIEIINEDIKNYYDNKNYLL
jgi:hypothetical protein